MTCGPCQLKSQSLKQQSTHTNNSGLAILGALGLAGLLAYLMGKK